MFLSLARFSSFVGFFGIDGAGACVGFGTGTAGTGTGVGASTTGSSNDPPLMLQIILEKKRETQTNGAM